MELLNELKQRSNQNWILNFLSNDQISSIGYRYLNDILSSTINIVDLNVEGNSKDEDARKFLLNDLWKNKTLNKFNISNNTLTNQDIEHIGLFILNNSILTEINLNRCEIDDDSIICFSRYLSTSSLQILDLNENLINDHGCKNVFSSIPITLTNLLINDNKITELSL